MRTRVVGLGLAALALSCGGDDAPAQGETGSTGPPVESTTTAPPDPNATGPTTSSGADGSSSSSDEAGSTGEPAPDPCEGEITVPFDAAADGTQFEEVVGDFTIETLRGPVTLSQHWTGCDTYTFLGQDNALWDTDVAGLVDNLPDNAYVFFFSTAADPTVAQGLVEGVGGRIESYLMSQGEDVYAARTERFRYVTTPAAQLPSWMIDLPASSDTASVLIDRSQRLREGGSLAFFNGAFTPVLQMAAYPPRYLNWEIEHQAMMDAQEVTSVVAVDGEILGDGTTSSGLVDVQMPDATTMAGFDTMDLWLRFECPGGHPYRVNCEAWDRIANVEVCPMGDIDCTDARLIGRAITSYWRPTRTLLDATPFLPLFDAGGTFTLRITWGPSWDFEVLETHLEIRLRDAAKGIRPSQITPLFAGGNFDAAYNDAYLPLDFTPPADAARVELVSIMTGHGADDTYGCAEFCNHAHTFTVGGTSAFALEYAPQVGNDPFICADLVDQGVMPNQWGTWHFGRAVWCPGWGVQPWRADVTSAVTLGQATTIEYAGSFDGTPGGPGGNIDMASYVVVYR